MPAIIFGIFRRPVILRTQSPIKRNYCLFGKTSKICDFRRFLNKHFHIIGCVQTVKQTVGNTVIPIDRNGNKRGVNVLPAFNGKRYIACFRAAIEHGQVVKLRGIFNKNLRAMSFIFPRASSTGTALQATAFFSIFQLKYRAKTAALNGASL